MKTLTYKQKELIAVFLSNMAVVWFSAAFIAPVNPTNTIRAAINGFIALIIAIITIKEVRRK